MRIGWFILLWPVATTAIYAIIYPVYLWLKDKYNERYRCFGWPHGGKGNKIHKTLGDIVKGREL